MSLSAFFSLISPLLPCCRYSGHHLTRNCICYSAFINYLTSSFHICHFALRIIFRIVSIFFRNSRVRIREMFALYKRPCQMEDWDCPPLKDISFQILIYMKDVISASNMTFHFKCLILIQFSSIQCFNFDIRLCSHFDDRLIEWMVGYKMWTIRWWSTKANRVEKLRSTIFIDFSFSLQISGKWSTFIVAVSFLHRFSSSLTMRRLISLHSFVLQALLMSIL